MKPVTIKATRAEELYCEKCKDQKNCLKEDCTEDCPCKKLQHFKCYFESRSTGTITVDAASVDEAKDKAWEELQSGMDDIYDDPEENLYEIEEVDNEGEPLF